MSSQVGLLADIIAGALTAENLSYYGDRGSKTAKAYHRRVLYVGTHRPSWVGTPYARPPEPRTSPNAPRDQSQHPRACNDYDEETAYDSYMNP